MNNNNLKHSSIDSELRTYLQGNEKLQWSGKPKTGLSFRKEDVFFIPFSLLWCGFAIFMLVSNLQTSDSLMFSLFGVPFVLMGLMMVFGRFIVDAKARANTIYGLTNDRIIIKSGIFSKQIKSMNINSLMALEYTEKPDGSGTINLGPKNPYTIMAHGMSWMPNVETQPQLESIPNVRQVYDQIVELRKK